MIVLSVAGPVIASSKLPYIDSNASGYIGFCDKNKHQVTSGSIYDQPFVWTAVSSTPAPSGYEHGKAVLIAYQPRREVNPGEWSGRQLTAASSFTNRAHPMAQATYADDPLLFFVQAFPPRWDGLIQLRMYYGAPNMGVHRMPYPATSIRITGDRWSVVSGGTVPCNAGKAVSDETRTLPSKLLASPAPLKVSGVARGSVSASPKPSSTGGVQNVASGRPNGVGASVVTAGLIGVAVLGGGGGGFYLWRRRRAVVDT
jgi:hypothetical protein